MSGLLQTIQLTRHHFLCAAQNPLYWTEAQLQQSTTKLFWRAALQVELKQHLGTIPGRVGRLRDSAYSTYDAFRLEALSKMQVSPDVASTWPGYLATMPDYDLQLFLFQSFWVFRCLLGPLIEALILLDRFLWWKRHSPDARLCCLFDPASGSLRNMAFVSRGKTKPQVGLD